MTSTVAVAMPDIAERVTTRLDDHAMAMLDIYYRMRGVPHPRNAIAEYASACAHDFLNCAFGVRNAMTGEIELTSEIVERFARFDSATSQLLTLARLTIDTHPEVYDSALRIDALYRDDISRLRAYHRATTATV